MQQEDKAALTALRILDLADEKASFCAKLLADMGAEVDEQEGNPLNMIGHFTGIDTAGGIVPFCVS